MGSMPPNAGAVGPEDEPKPGMPGWVKAAIIALVVVALVIVTLTLTGVHDPKAGGHGP
jgi:hypothetical protein